MNNRIRRIIHSLPAIVVVVTVASFLVINNSAAAVEPYPPSETTPVGNITSYNPARSGYPHPLESDDGWGGGAKPWDIVDGRRTYPDEWARGLAFTGGSPEYIEECGWRQVTINFAVPTTFNKVVVWHHGKEHVPNTYKIQYWDGSEWVDAFSTTNGHAYLKYPADPPINWWESWSTPTENTFATVTSAKVKFLFNNCDIEHGWIYNFEVYYEVDYSLYRLAVSSTGGGSVTTPGEGTFSYAPETVVDLVAEAEEGYRFANWTGDVDTIADVEAALTTITMKDSCSITANFELEEGLCSLTISSTGGGSVTTPGEGTFARDEGTVVDLVAEPEVGYLFVNWTGDVNTIGDINAAATNITMDDNYSITANFEYEPQEVQLGVKSGDWIKIDYTITGWPAGEPYPEWLKLEFLSFEGTTANVQVTMHISDGTEQSDTVPADLGEGGSEVFGLSGFVISANLTTGDSIYITGYGDITIEGETARTYAGARRTVVYASVSQYGVQLTYYWDKLTGVMVETSTTWEDMTITAKATETNMWEATTGGTLWWPWIIVAVVAVGVVLFFISRRDTSPVDTSG